MRRELQPRQFLTQFQLTSRRIVAGLSTDGIAHLRPAMMSNALSAVTTLVTHGLLREQTLALSQ